MSSCVLVSEWLLAKVVLTADFRREETSMTHATGCLTETAVLLLSEFMLDEGC